MNVLGIVGGSGLYAIEELEILGEEAVSTPFGEPSDNILCGRVKGTEQRVLFLPRHGRGHRIAPSNINYRANIAALKKLGATHVVSVSAVGSMEEHLAPGDLVVVDQFIDLTKRRASTFFDDGIAAHVAFSDPVCPILSGALYDAARRVTDRAHNGGTYVCIEGPQFSTRAESMVYRSWGVDVIGMTNMPEAKLAREAELPYATLALVTDYDCWHVSEEAVSVEAVVAALQKNIQVAKKLLIELAKSLPNVDKSPAKGALKHAVMTAPEKITPETRARLNWLTFQ